MRQYVRRCTHHRVKIKTSVSDSRMTNNDSIEYTVNSCVNRKKNYEYYIEIFVRRIFKITIILTRIVNIVLFYDTIEYNARM